MSLNIKMIKSIRFFRNFQSYSSCSCNKLQLFQCTIRKRFFSAESSSSLANSNDNQEILSEETKDEVKSQVIIPKSKGKSKVDSPENAKLLKVSIIGLPNAGKSTLINALTHYDVCPVSRRPHTTRVNQKAVYLNENTQLVFVDTPGLVSVNEIRKFSFEESFVYGPEKSFGTSHMIAVIHDVSSAKARDKLDFRIKTVLEKNPNKKTILILNKIDSLQKKGELLEIVKHLTAGIVGGRPLPIIPHEHRKQSHLPMNTSKLLNRAKHRTNLKAANKSCSENEDKADKIASTLFSENEIKNGMHKLGWPHFNDVFMISALKGDGIDLLRKYMILNAVSENWLYDNETLTNFPPARLALKMLQAKLLDYVAQDVPFYVKPVLEFWDENDKGEVIIYYKILCPKEHYVGRIIGTAGSTIKRITNETQKALHEILGRPVKLTVEAIYKKGKDTKG